MKKDVTDITWKLHLGKLLKGLISLPTIPPAEVFNFFFSTDSLGNVS